MSKKGKGRRNKKRNRGPPTDPLSLEHSRRHGVAVKKGIRRAKAFKLCVRKAFVELKESTKAEVAVRLLEGRSKERVVAQGGPPSPCLVGR